MSTTPLTPQTHAAMSLGAPGAPGGTETAAIRPDWSVQDAAQLYRIEQWSQGYFCINQAGHVEVHPDLQPDRRIDLKQLVDELKQRGLQLPLLLRFTDILKHRVGALNQAFATAMTEHDYNGVYCCVYPIKVNQQRHVVEEIRRFGRPYCFGLEVGSKPELLAVMAIVDDPVTPIICNGFKDDQYIEAVLLATKLGKNVIPVVEKFSELRSLVRFAGTHSVKPTIGIRIKLATHGKGRWEASGGLRSKFGLFASELLDAVTYLREHDMLDCLKLLHGHLGSQIPDVRNLKNAIIELARAYAELRSLGVQLDSLDVGGGLGVDYDGSKSDFESSINYSLQEYANNIVFHIREVCEQAAVPHPRIISESGRATVAYHSVLVFNVLGTTDLDQPVTPPADDADLPAPLHTLCESHRGLTETNFAEYYHDAQVALDETHNLFKLGYCSLEHRGLAERLYFAIGRKVLHITRQMDPVPDEFAALESTLSSLYFCNYSIFQSLPDSWAVDQLFPTMPIHRLDEEPTCRGVLADVTCDSDGKIDRFIDSHKVKRVLELHPLREGEPYYLASFLVGAYQEILGDLHNLFGDTNAVHIRLGEDGQAHVEEVIEGDSVQEVLHYVQFNADELMRAIRKHTEQALAAKRLTLAEARQLLSFYESSLKGYTYLQ